MMAQMRILTEAEAYVLRITQLYSAPPWERSTLAWLLLGWPPTVHEPLPGEPDLSAPL